MSTISPAQLMTWHDEVVALRTRVGVQRQILRAHPGSGPDDPMRTGLDAAFDSLSTTLSILGHLWVLADITD